MQINDKTLKDRLKNQLNDNLIIYKPISYTKATEQLIYDYWKLHGKKICINRMIFLYTNAKENLELECIINPQNTYILEPNILECKESISMLNTFYID